MVTLGDPTWLKKHLYYPVYILMVSWNRGTSRAGWFIMENPIIESGWFRCTPILGNLRIYIYIPSGTQVLRWPHTGCCSAADDHVVSCSATGRGGGWGGVHYRSWNVDHVVDAPLQMITLYHAPRQGGVGWGVGCIIVRAKFSHRSGTVACDRRYWMQGAGVSSTGWFLVRQSLDWFWWLFNGDNRNN